MTEYFLSNHVHFCCQGDAIVFLDLLNDEYSMIDGEQGSAFRAFFCDVQSLSASDQAHPDRSINSRSSGALEDVLNELVGNGLLTTERARGKPVVPTVATLPGEQLITNDTGSMVRIEAGHVWGFVVSCIRAALRLRFARIQDTTAAVARRKALKSPQHKFDPCKARDLVAAFNRLRSLFPANYLCIFDSLALVEFLARYNVFPNWVFAVRPELWAAHCWVQEGATVLNEDVEEACDYVPIMVI